MLDTKKITVAIDQNDSPCHDNVDEIRRAAKDGARGGLLQMRASLGVTWTDARGRLWAVDELEDSHAINIINHERRVFIKVGFMEDPGYGVDFEVVHDNLMMFNTRYAAVYAEVERRGRLDELCPDGGQDPVVE
jgi:hypothetical protein